MGYRYRGEGKYPTPPKDLPTVEDFEKHLTALEKIMPMTRDEIIRRAVQKYYFKKVVDKGIWHISEVLRSQNHRCFYCGKVLSNRLATVDHKIPMSRGGTNTRENIVAACSKCNNDKESMTVEEYAEYLQGFGISTPFLLTNTHQ